jgi:hypothetical protein
VFLCKGYRHTPVPEVLTVATESDSVFCKGYRHTPVPEVLTVATDSGSVLCKGYRHTPVPEVLTVATESGSVLSQKLKIVLTFVGSLGSTLQRVDAAPDLAQWLADSGSGSSMAISCDFFLCCDVINGRSRSQKLRIVLQFVGSSGSTLQRVDAAADPAQMARGFGIRIQFGHIL